MVLLWTCAMGIIGMDVRQTSHFSPLDMPFTPLEDDESSPVIADDCLD